MPLPMSDAKSLRAEMKRVEKIREGATEQLLPREPRPPPEPSSIMLALRTADPQAIECVLCVGMLVWGLWLMLSGNPLLSEGLGEIAPPWAWGSALLVLGGSHMLGVLYGLDSLRCRSSFGSLFIWAMATVSCLFVPTMPGSIPVAYGLITALSVWVHLRVEK